MNIEQNPLKQVLTLEWGGQMMASLFWTTSVFVYGVESTGDVLQLCAALAWVTANLAALRVLNVENDRDTIVESNLSKESAT